MYILSRAAVKSIIDSPILRAKLLLSLNISESTLYRLYSNNEVNNDLTKAAAIEVIEADTQLPVKKILDRVPKSTSKVTT